jgi:ABC-type multidrug transport system fused ATPase/permease subunit
MTLLGLLLVAILTAQLINPQVVRRFIDAAQTGNVLWGATAVFITIAFIEQALLIAATYISERVGWAATNRLREDLALHCLQLGMDFHNSHSPGEMIERIDGDVNDLARFFSQFVLVLLNNLLLLVGVLALLWREDWRIGLALTAICLTSLLLLNMVRLKAMPHWQAVRQANADLFGFLEERFRGREDIRPNGAVEYTMHRLYALMRQLLAHEYPARWLNVASLAIPLLTFGLAYIAAYLLSDSLFQAGTMSLGSAYLIFHYLGLLSSPLWRIVNEVQSLQQAGGSIGRIQALHQQQNPIQNGAGAALPDEALAMQFESVSFQYAPEGEVILADIDFHLAGGRTLGLLGRTGSGKTTLTRLLLRLYDPTRGVVRLAGQDVRSANVTDLRRHIGMVTQEVQLFQASVRDNVTFFDESVPDEAITAVFHQLGLTGWLTQLPHGLDTMLSAGGAGLSAGEAQLLAFVRVFLQDPGLVILDEASSRLDPVTERLIDGAVQRLLAGRTAIIIAHRLATVQQLDEVMILANGRMLEHGSRSKLAADPTSHFAHLLQTGLEELESGD